MPPDTEFDPYRVLGIARSASDADVAAAYRALAKRLHPDLHGTNAESRMREVNRAFRILGDPAARRDWDAAHRVTPAGPHWAQAPSAEAPRRGVAGPAAWTGWEDAEPRQAATGPDRVRVRGAWPRNPPPPAAKAGVRDSIWLAVGVGLVVIAGAVALGWVASAQPVVATAGEALSRSGISPAVRLALDPEHEVAVYKQRDGGLGLVAVERSADGWAARILASTAAAHPVSILLHVDGEDQDGLPPIAFGRAEGGVAEVRVAGGEAEVANGTWILAVPGITDGTSLAWEFVLADGTLLRGTGVSGESGG